MKTSILLSLLLMSSFVRTGYDTPLITAIQEGNVQEVTRLLKDNADTNERNTCGYTPSFYALDGRPPIFIKLLLEHSADPNAYSHTSKTCKVLDRAIIFGNEEHVKLLLEHGADLFQVMIENFDLMKQNNNAKDVQAERRKQRVATRLLCAKEIHIDLPPDIVREIDGAMEKIK